MKKLARLIIPQKVLIYRFYFNQAITNIKRFIFYSNSFYKINSESKLRGQLTMIYHVIEKGLTMPTPKMGFGYEKVNELINFCNIYISKKYDTKAIEFEHSVKLLDEYLKFHANNNYNVEENIEKTIKLLVEKSQIKTSSEQLIFDSSDFFKYKDSSFADFCLSRHTVRNYSEKDIPISVINECILLAQTSPSACNRQPSRVYIIKHREIIDSFLKLQNGNRGFGFLANAIVVFTSDISVFQSIIERNEPYLNSGMFAMTFIYALHHYKIGSCALNWSVTTEIDLKLRKLLNVPDNELITMTLSCGYLPNRLSVARSPRLDINSIVRYYL